jgi:thiol:disulfide interchange protein DsbD
MTQPAAARLHFPRFVKADRTVTRHPLRLFTCLLIPCILAMLGAGAMAQTGPAAPAASSLLPPGQSAAQKAVPVVLETALFALPPGPDGGRLAVLLFTPTPGWHAYGHMPGDTGQPASASLRLLPEGAPLLVYFPEGRQKPDLFEPEKTANIHDTPTRVFVPLPPDAAKGSRLAGTLNLFLCSATSCWPAALPVDMPLDAASPPPPAETQPWWPEFDAAKAATAKVAAMTQAQAAPDAPTEAIAPAPAATGESAAALALTPRSLTPSLEVAGLVKAALLAFLAGFILNFMPCVLPVVSLKLSSLLAVCGHENAAARHRILREHNLFFALGVMVYFLALSLFLWLAGMAWGQIFQSTTLTLTLTVVLFALTMSLFGVFHLPVIDLKMPGKATGDSRTGAFLTGVLATLLATPCSGPFLGGVLAWTLLQPLATVMAVFTCLGLGMALPYILLAIWPQLARFMPRPGDWMVSLEQGMGFLLAGSCIYFLTILPTDKLVPALLALWATALAAWVWGRFTNLSQSGLHRFVVRGAAVLLVVAATAFAAADREPPRLAWVAWTPTEFAARHGRENLLVTFTADWCPTCKLLERTVLVPDTLGPLVEKHGLTLMKADLTSQSPEAMALLAALGSRSIPLTALFPAGPGASAPLVLRDLYTGAALGEAMDEAFAATPPAK